MAGGLSVSVLESLSVRFVYISCEQTGVNFCSNVRKFGVLLYRVSVSKPASNQSHCSTAVLFFMHFLRNKRLRRAKELLHLSVKGVDGRYAESQVRL